QATTAACEPFSLIAPPASTSPPTISGIPKTGKVLTENHGSWSDNPTGFAYQWLRCDSNGGSCTAIPGATGQTYAPAPVDVGHRIRVAETANNLAGAGSATSGPTDPVVFPASAGLGRTRVHGKAVKVALNCLGDRGAHCAVRIQLRANNKLFGSKSLTLVSGQN